MPDYPVILTIGSNMPDARARVKEAAQWLETLIKGFEISQIYITRPLSGVGADYANAVVKGHTELRSEKLNCLLKHYELENGRDDTARIRNEVPIDIDLVFFGNKCLRPAELSREYYLTGAKMLGIS